MYRALRAFLHHGKRIKTGDVVDFPKPVANDYKERGLIYESKEEKRVYDRTTKATIEHDGGPMFLVKKGHQVIDRLKKSEAEQLRDEINAEL